MEIEEDPLDPNYVPNYEHLGLSDSCIPNYEPIVQPETYVADFNPVTNYQPILNADYAAEPLLEIKTEPEEPKEPNFDQYPIVEDLPPLSVPDAPVKEKRKHKSSKSKDSERPKKSLKRKRRTKLQMSAMSKEVEELTSSVPFYCCAVCEEVRLHRLEELQLHVAGHKDRVTSWDLKVRNQKLRKTTKKAKKKLLKIKEEVLDPEIKEEVIDPEYNDPSVNVPDQSVSYDANVNSDAIVNGDGNVNGDSNVNSDICNDLANEIGNIMMGNLDSNIAKELDNIIAKNVGATQVGEKTGEFSEKPGEISEKTGELSEKTGELSEKMRELSETVVKSEKSAAELDNLERIFKCGGCGKQFLLGYYLKLHVRSHTGEKPYICQECGQSFITASKLGRHRKRTHLAVRVICRVCRRPYTRLEFLMRHFHKQHAADKIEGEPYDYNAILPYLKDLEEELRVKQAEEERRRAEEARRLPGEAPGEAPGGAPGGAEPKQEPKIEPKAELEVNVKVEPVIKEESELKAEEDSASVGGGVGLGAEGDGEGGAGEPDTFGADFDDYFADCGGNDASDDEDYFPDNTWLPAAAEETPPRKKRAKTKTKTSDEKTRPRAREDAALTTCQVCHKTVSSSTYLRIHMRIHSRERPHGCARCPKRFITASKLGRHLLTHARWDHGDTDAVKTENDIKEEKTDGNEDENNPEKPKRGRKKRRRKNAVEGDTPPEPPAAPAPPTRHKKPRPHACEFCKKRFLYVEALQVHRRCHAGETLDLHCGFCLEPCADLPALKAHEALHAAAGARPYLCTLCGRTYTKKETMIYHRRMHSADNKFQCDMCPKAFNAKNKLQRHLLSHRAGKSSVRYECPVCAHCFHTRYHVQMHLHTHEKEGVILEENRGQVLAMVLQNARRVPLEAPRAAPAQLEWGDERSRVCNICGELFMHFYLLEQHLKSHGSSLAADEPTPKKHVCSVCNKAFKLSYYLKLHSFTHTKEKPCICQQCGKGFITRGKLNRHLETHAGLKKYQCPVCCKHFTRPSYLRIHIRTIHGTQDYNFKLHAGGYGGTLDDVSLSHDSV